MGNNSSEILTGEPTQRDPASAKKRADFVAAISQGNLQKAKENYVGIKNYDINKKYPFGQTLLYYSAFKGYNEIVEFLLTCGADMTISDDNGNFPIHTACNKGQTKVVEVLIKHGANINLLSKKNHAPLFFAVCVDQLDVARLLIQHGANINARTAKNTSLLHIACQHGNMKMVELLVTNGAMVNVPGSTGSQDSPIHIASNKGYYKIVSYLIDNGAHLSLKGEIMSPIYTAVHHKRIEAINVLLDAGADVRFVDTQVNQTCLHLAATRNLTGVIVQLLSHGADINAADKHGLTPLHLASIAGNIEAARVLIQHGANLSAESKKGNTPLKIAKTDTMKSILTGSVTQPSAPVMPEEEFVFEKTLEQQLEEKREELVVVNQRKTELEDEIETLNIRIAEKSDQSNDGSYSQIQDHLECPICLEIPYSPTKIFQCEQGHIFCELCYRKGLTFCPECRVELNGEKLIRNRRLEDVVKGLQVSDSYLL